MSSDWFYHAPQRQRSEEYNAPQIPLMSQIPGLSDLPADDSFNQKPGFLLRETDSEYIKLAKMGGRKNLLYFRPVAPKKEPQKYPVPEWWGYKASDQAAEETQPRRKPAVPDYMVYQPHQAPPTEQPGLPAVGRSRLPFAQDGQSSWKREANEAANPKRGPNIVIQKQRKSLAPIEPRIRDVSREPVAGVNYHRPRTTEENSDKLFTPELPARMRTFVATREVEPDNLSKVLNYGYQRDWLEQRELARQLDQQKRALYAENLKRTLQEREMSGNYNQKHQNNEPPPPAGQSPGSANEEKVRRSAQSGSRVAPPKPWRTTTKTANHGAPPPAAAQSLYKMNKYKNVPSRLDANMSRVQTVD